MTSERTATVVAAVAAIAVLVLGGLFIIGSALEHRAPLFNDPTEPRIVTTTVTHVVGSGQTPSPKTTKTVTKTRTRPGKRAQTTTTIVTETPGTSSDTTTTTNEANDSLLQRVLTGAGFLFFRLALLCAAAFLAGAVVQRALLGRFAIKIGPVEIPELPAAAAASKNAISRVQASIKSQISKLTQSVGAQLKENSDATAHVGELAADAARAVSELQKRVSELESGK